MMFHSLRLRLTVWYSGVLLAALLLFGGLLWFVVGQYLIAEVDQRLARSAQGVGTVISSEIGEPDFLEELREYARAAPGALLRVRDAAGAEMLPDTLLRSVALTGRLGTYTVPLDGRHYRVHSENFAIKGRLFQIASGVPLAEVERRLAQFRTVLLVTIPFVVLTAFAGGYWVSGRALAPVDELTKAARKISVENLSDRLTTPKTGDELQRLAETWNEMLERLESSVRRIASFTSDASHELRTPLSVITTTAELALRRDRDVEQYRRALSDILAEAGRMSALAGDLLELARADAAHGTLPFEAVDIAALAREVTAELAPAAERGAIRLAAEGDTATATVNRAALRRLILILADNALKHTPAGGSIVIRADANAGGVLLSVTDTGEGITAADAPHVFDRFYRADKARNHRNGVGLGLSIAQTIAQIHGAQIQLVSSPGRGSRFFLTIPAQRLSANLQMGGVDLPR